MAIANPLAGVTGPRAGRGRGRSRHTIANLRSKYPDMVAPRGGMTTGGQAPGVSMAKPSIAPVAPVAVLPGQGDMPNLAALQAATAATSSLAGLQAMMTSLQQLQQAAPQPSQRPDQARRGGAGKPLGAWAHEMGTTPKQNIQIAKHLGAKYGWNSGEQWEAWVELGGLESGWRSDAENPSSGAFGIPQALPATKMNKRAQQGLAWPQIIWMREYIKERYGTPLAALKFHRAHNWY